MRKYNILKRILLTRTLTGWFLFSGIQLISGPVLLAQNGKYLRGEVWQKFSVEKATADFYVSPAGDDNWSGTLSSPNATHSDGPFRTLARAQQAVRELKKTVYKPKGKPVQENYIGSGYPLGSGKDILVVVREGYYTLDTTLFFTPDDGGERVETNQPTGAWEYHKLKDYYVTWAAFPGEHPVISGGRIIKDWMKEGSLWSAPANGLQAENLVAGGRAQTPARTPNEGMYTVARASPTAETFFFRDDQLRSWPDMEQNRLILYLRWHMQVNSIKKVDEKKRLAYLKKPDAGITVIPPRYYIENVRALLDTTGEWFFDKKDSRILWMPPAEIQDPNNTVVTVPVLTSLVKVEGEPGKPVRNLRFYGLTFEATNAGDYAFSMKYASYCELADSRIRALGGSGLFLGPGCFETRIIGNTFKQIGKHGVVIAGNPYPSRFADIIRQNRISRNRFDNIGEHYGNVISVRNTLYTTISHNEISNNKGRYPVYIGGWANAEEALEGSYVVEYNHLHHVQSRSDDSGVITTGGYTHNSVIRNNLIHDVTKGMFNDNVAIWFDNLSLGWTAENNIYYNLEQGEMKLCAANLTDNNYINNYKIESPEIPPEGIITGMPVFRAGKPSVLNEGHKTDQISTGKYVTISSVIKNTGSSGIQDIDLRINGKLIDEKGFPVIKGNRRTIRFEYRFARPGDYQITVAGSEPVYLKVTGKPLSWFCDDLKGSFRILPEGDSLTLTARVSSPEGLRDIPAILYDKGKNIKEMSVQLTEGEEKILITKVLLPAGEHQLRIGNSNIVKVYVFAHRPVDLSRQAFGKYCSARARPCEVAIEKNHNRYMIKAAGTDFFHGEDSYATAYLKKPVEGNFVATVKVVKYGPGTHEWYRTGLFVRNDITKSYDTGMGSLGSVLLFVSPGRAGMDWDEHGDGCMHKASSQNHPAYNPTPLWLRLVRHGNSFSGYVSYDGKHWTVERHTGDIPGIKEAVNLGLAAGGPDGKQYTVWFEDFNLEMEKK